MRPEILENMCELFLLVENLNNHMFIHILWVFSGSLSAIIVIRVKLVFRIWGK